MDATWDSDSNEFYLSLLNDAGETRDDLKVPEEMGNKMVEADSDGKLVLVSFAYHSKQWTWFFILKFMVWSNHAGQHETENRLIIEANIAVHLSVYSGQCLLYNQTAGDYYMNHIFWKGV